VLAILVGVLVATALLLVAKKGFFPHYMNVLAPVLVLPVSFAVDAWASRHRAAVIGVVAVIVVAMCSSTVRYLRTVDRLV
jgi:hypothetical protein